MSHPIGLNVHFGKDTPVISYVENSKVVEWKTLPVNVMSVIGYKAAEDFFKERDKGEYLFIIKLFLSYLIVCEDLAKNIFDFVSQFDSRIQNECWKNLGIYLNVHSYLMYSFHSIGRWCFNRSRRGCEWATKRFQCPTAQINPRFVCLFSLVM
jgi:hypothetical protein